MSSQDERSGGPLPETAATPTTDGNRERTLGTDKGTSGGSTFETPLAGALECARRGFYVFPLRGKIPAITGWKTAATRDEDQIRDWAELFPGCNFGIATERSGLVVLDEDTPGDLAAWEASEGIAPTETFAVATGRPGGGTHYWRRSETVFKSSSPMKRAGYDVDVKAQGGLVVCPGSVHASGAVYRVVNDVPVAPLPDAIARRLRLPNERLHEVEPPAETLPDLLSRDYVDSALRGLRDDCEVAALAPLGEEPRWEPTVMHAAYRVVELSNGAPGLFPRDAALRWLLTHAPTDADFDAADVERKFAHAADEKGYSGGREKAEAAPAEASDYEREVARELLRLQVRDEARRRFDAAGATALELPPLARLDEFLEEDDPPAMYRVEGLWPTGGRILLAAAQKAGKTTTVSNLLRALVDGEEFLGRFATEPAGRVILVDDELDESMLRRWLRDQDIAHADRIELVTLRGRLSTFNLLDPTTRARWAKHLGPADVLIFDCLRPALDALGLSEDKESGRFLEALDELMHESGIGELMVVHHMGHSSERSRGDSRLLDWPEANWKIVRGEGDDSHTRYFSAYGRDVDQREAQLVFDDRTRHLRLAGGSRKDAKASETFPVVEEALRAAGKPLTATELEKSVQKLGNLTRGEARAAIKYAVKHRLVQAESEGPGKPTHHTLAVDDFGGVDEDGVIT